MTEYFWAPLPSPAAFQLLQEVALLPDQFGVAADPLPFCIYCNQTVEETPEQLWLPTLILSDSTYATGRLQYLLKGYRRRQQLDQAFLRVRWIPAHTGEKALIEARAHFYEQQYNPHADELAVEDERQRTWPRELRAQLLQQLPAAALYQYLLGNFLHQRMDARPHPERQAGFTNANLRRRTPKPPYEDNSESNLPEHRWPNRDPRTDQTST